MELTRYGKIAATFVFIAETAFMVGFACAKSKDSNDIAGAMIVSALVLSVLACVSVRCQCPRSFFSLNSRERLEEQLIADLQYQRTAERGNTVTV